MATIFDQGFLEPLILHLIPEVVLFFIFKLFQEFAEPFFC